MFLLGFKVANTEMMVRSLPNLARITHAKTLKSLCD